jgi:hypothetical protein
MTVSAHTAFKRWGGDGADVPFLNPPQLTYISLAPAASAKTRQISRKTADKRQEAGRWITNDCADGCYNYIQECAEADDCNLISSVKSRCCCEAVLLSPHAPVAKWSGGRLSTLARHPASRRCMLLKLHKHYHSIHPNNVKSAGELMTAVIAIVRVVQSLLPRLARPSGVNNSEMMSCIYPWSPWAVSR